MNHVSLVWEAVGGRAARQRVCSRLPAAEASIDRHMPAVPARLGDSSVPPYDDSSGIDFGHDKRNA